MEGRERAKQGVDDAYNRLSKTTEEVEKPARPATSVPLTARYLARLKDRPNRYTTLRASVMTEYGKGRESDIIATEYNLGPTASAAADEVSSHYGDSVAGLTYGDAMKTVLEF